MAKISYTDEHDALLAELGLEDDTPEKSIYTKEQERVIGGLGEISNWVSENGRVPKNIEGRDIFERLYAVRLERIKNLENIEFLDSFDRHALLQNSASIETEEELTKEELLAALEIESEDDDLTILKHVRPYKERQAAQDVADRKPCAEFDTQFKTLFQQIERDLRSGARHTVSPVKKETGGISVEQDDIFILKGQIAYVAQTGQDRLAPQGDKKARQDKRLRVIFSNGTESNLLRRSLEKVLYDDKRARRVIIPLGANGPLFETTPETPPAEQVTERNDGQDKDLERNIETGTIYVLRSDHPDLRQDREITHKIGFTTGSVASRIAKAKNDPTYLMHDVESVAEFKITNWNPRKVEKILHRLFSDARLSISMPDRFSRNVHADEWFRIPLWVVKDAVTKIEAGTIADYYYDLERAELISKR